MVYEQLKLYVANKKRASGIADENIATAICQHSHGFVRPPKRFPSSIGHCTALGRCQMKLSRLAVGLESFQSWSESIGNAKSRSNEATVPIAATENIPFDEYMGNASAAVVLWSEIREEESPVESGI